MRNSRTHDWDPRAPSVLQDQSAAYDELRSKCPVAHSDFLQWSLFRHQDVVRVIEDHETFSNVTSTHLSVPNGMDPPEHTEYRRAIEPCFDGELVRAFKPVCRHIAVELLEVALTHQSFDYIEAFALPFSLRAQCAFLGWPDDCTDLIRAWTKKNQDSTLAGDRAVMADIAREFTSHIHKLLNTRGSESNNQVNDVTARLMNAQVNGRLLNDEEIVSVLRNWTVGEVASLSSAIGTVAHHLAVDPGLQRRLRSDPSLIPVAIDEILRICSPLVANKRVAIRDVEIGNRKIVAGERISVIWVSANRDEQVFEAAEEVRFDRDPSLNLVFGAGIHACPGAQLARLEIRVALEELLRRTSRIELDSEILPQRAVFPANGFASLPLLSYR